MAISAAASELIACADAGCTYAPDWMARITTPLRDGTSRYALGGSCLDPASPTLWDIASAPFLGVKLDPEELSKSCTARSMAFTKDLWHDVGGFPESVFFGEDTLFDLNARSKSRTVFVSGAKALYHPRNTFRSACHQLTMYAISDGLLGVRRSRLIRNATRCLLGVLALLCLPWTTVALMVVLGIQAWLAFSPDWLLLQKAGPRVLLARFAFACAVPWIVTVGHLRGRFTSANPSNRQNL
jgi:GT2 family glycosyltransferase